MFKNLMNGVSLSSLMLRDADNEGGADAKAALREKLAKGNVTPAEPVIEKKEEEETDEDDEDDEDNEEKEEDDEVDPNAKPPADETEEQKNTREEAEKVAAKAKRKEDRVQKRINTIAAERDTARAEIERLKKQLDANPELKLTAEEVETRAEAIATEKAKAKELAELETSFQDKCDKLQAGANKIDKEFDAKINLIASDFGAIPSVMIGLLSDLDNGAEVLAYIANDDEVAETVWSYSNNLIKMTKELVQISNKLAEEAKPKKKKLSKVPDPGEPVKGNRQVSKELTEADAKDMNTYVAKRQAQILEKRKLNGFG